MWKIIAAITLVSAAGCALQPDAEALRAQIGPLPAFGLESCDFHAIMRTGPRAGQGVPACDPPDAPTLAFACGLAAVAATEMEEPPEAISAYRVRAERCELTDAQNGKAQCDFEMDSGSGNWTTVEAHLQRVWTTYGDELVFEQGIAWRVRGACGAHAENAVG